MNTKASIASLLFLLALIFLASAAASFAQETPSVTIIQATSLQFPITELGNCDSQAACKTYCANEVNREACTSFAKQRGLYKVSQAQKVGTEILQNAQTELGCTSETTCRAICQEEANREKCTAFGKKHNLMTKRAKPNDRQILQKAKEALGCDSETSCKEICQNPENQEKCSIFAREANLSGGIKKVGPGGCSSKESCKAYCAENREACKQFAQKLQESGGDMMRQSMPSGCTDPETCKKLCQGNPSECKMNQGSMSGQMQQMSLRELCQTNPEKCKNQAGQGMQMHEGMPMQDETYPKDAQQNTQPPQQFEQAQNTPSVQGAATAPSLWQRFLNLLIPR